VRKLIYEKAYAKINLGLNVVNKRNDGYHNLKMVMASVDLYDELIFEDHKDIVVICDVDVCSMEDNLVYKTAKLMKKDFAVDRGVKIILTKRIRSGAGLAGGSSDAAATIRGLNKLWKLGLSFEEQFKIASFIGSDVPFCLCGELAVVEGRGEIITNLDIDINLFVVLIYPDYQSFTTEVFKLYKDFKDNAQINKLVRSIKEKDIKEISKRAFNDLESVVNIIGLKNDKITINDIKQQAMLSGCLGSTMSGSGSTVLGFTHSWDEAEIIKKKLVKTYSSFTIQIAKILHKS
jgi:4-diphosphocytidyl-2-C-methyl-D-erythritol kinase